MTLAQGEKNGERERKTEKEFEEASVTVNTICHKMEMGGMGDSFRIFRKLSL